MIKKFRKKFIIVNMIFVSLVLFIILLVLLSVSKIRLEGNMRGILSRAVREPEEFASNYLLFTNKDKINIFIATIKDDEIVEWHTEYGYIDKNKAIKAINKVVEKGIYRGEIKEYHFLFTSMLTEEGRMYGFIDTSSSNVFLQEQTCFFIIVGIIACLLFFIISFVLSNIAIDPIKKSLNQQKQFVADASHELKTPITVLLANISLINSRQTNLDNESKKRIENIEAETKRMQKLIENLLYLAKSDIAREVKDKSIIDLNDILWYCVLNFDSVAFEMDINFKYSITEKPLKMLGNKENLIQLFIILLDNAFKYGGNGSTVIVKLKEISNKAVFSINNNGEHIDNKDIKYIFERFYRGDKARNRAKGSVGLGLAIAKEVVSSHQGKISVTSSAAKGTTFEVKFPTI